MAGEFGPGHDACSVERCTILASRLLAARFRLKDFPNTVQFDPGGEERRNNGDLMRKPPSHGFGEHCFVSKA